MILEKGLVLYDYVNNRRVELLEGVWSGRAACCCFDLDENGHEYHQHFTTKELKGFEVLNCDTI